MTDLGTEFGVEVAEDGVCGVQVFQGLVTVTAGPADQFAIGTPRKLCAGEAMRVHRTGIDGTVKVVNVAPNASWKFVRSLSVNPRTYRETVLADKPLFYWTFDEPTGPAFEQVRQLPELALYPKGSAGRYLHSSLSNGGLSLGRAANFSWAAGCFASNVLGQGKMPGAWAIEFWMQAVGDRNGYRRQYLLNVGGPPKDDLGKWNDPAIIFDWGDRGGTNNELQLVDNHGRTTGGPQIEDSRWHHVILVFFGNVRVSVGGPKAGGVLDGAFQAVDPGQIQSAFDLSQGLLVGTDTSSFSHGFCGRLDELAFYDLSNLTTTQIEARVKEMAQRHLATAQPKPAAR